MAESSEDRAGALRAALRDALDDNAKLRGKLADLEGAGFIAADPPLDPGWDGFPKGEGFVGWHWIQTTASGLPIPMRYAGSYRYEYRGVGYAAADLGWRYAGPCLMADG